MTDAVVIGGGVIGLSITRALCKSGLNTILLEKNERTGDDTSSRNSGVIHAGIYYPENFLKSILCVEGNKLIYEYAQAKNITHKKYGKYIIANSSSESNKLNFILEQGRKNKVDIFEADKDDVLDNNPGLTFHRALYSPNSGVLDVPEYVTALEGDIQHFGGLISTRTCFFGAKKENHQFKIH